MNAAALSRMKVVSGTASELIQAIKDSAMKQRVPGHLETAIYKATGESNEILALSLWQSLNDLPDLDSQATLPVNRVLNDTAKLLSRDVFKMVKDYRLMTAQPVFSRIRLFTVPTTSPHLWIDQGVQIINRDVKQWSELVRVWFGRLVNEPQDTLILLLRMDWLSLQEQQDYKSSELTAAFFERLEAVGAKTEHGDLQLQEEVQLAK